MATARDIYYGGMVDHLDSMYFATYYSASNQLEIRPATFGTYDIVHETLLPPTHEASRTLALMSLYQEIANYSLLDEGWDGYVAEPVSQSSQVDARVFISSLPPRFDLPKPMLASDGEVSLYWDLRGSYLEASFPGDGTFHYIYNRGSVRFASDDCAVTAPILSAEFLSFLEAV